MATLRGIVVEVKTDENWGFSGTFDNIYLGVYGRGGGGEFRLDVANFNDFQHASKNVFVLGDVWETGATAGGLLPIGSKAADNPGLNYPPSRYIDLDLVDYVYLRKGDTRKGDTDDAYRLQNIDVALYSTSGGTKKRAFAAAAVQLGNESGHQVWLREL